MPSSVYVLAPENPSCKSLASSNQKLNTKHSSTVSCRICLSKLIDPASLICGHKFCEECLLNYWEVNDRPNCIECPLCRKNAHNVNFTKALPSNNDFRKTFNSLEDITETEISRQAPTNIPYFLTLGFWISALYYLLRWIGLPI